MPPFNPTGREIVLLAVLLCSLLYISTEYYAHTVTPHYDYALLSMHEEDIASGKHPDHHGQYTLQTLNPPVRWANGQIPETKIVAHAPGWTILDNLFLLNGTLYIVSDQPGAIPERSYMISTGVFIANEREAVAAREPTDNEMRIIGTGEAQGLLGNEAERLDGVTWLANDPKQFVTHYYHWSAELFFGFWRTYSSLDPSISPSGETSLPAPRRMVFPRIDAANWRDYAFTNQWVLRASFPSIATEFMNDWKERAALARPIIFDRVVLADRAAAMNGEMYLRTQRTAANAFVLPGSVHWWTPIRKNVLFAIDDGTPAASALQGAISVPVITYISRQGWNRRMLRKEDDERLVKALLDLRTTHGYEVNIVEMNKLSRIEQFRLAGRTTIMMGVHGNGLTALVWMQPTPRSTVMEFFYPGGFAHDYEYTTRALGMVHYGFWNERYFTRPDVPPVAYPEGFQGNDIPIDGEAVAQLCIERLTLSDEADD